MEKTSKGTRHPEDEETLSQGEREKERRREREKERKKAREKKRQSCEPVLALAIV
jgi:hypothetical protein